MKAMTELDKSIGNGVNPFHATGFWCFQGVSKETSGMKCVKEGLAMISQSLLKLTPQQIPHSPPLL